jgi:branched-chain amino acid transport system ATP-binding protein
MLEIKDLHTYYGNIHALKGISLQVEQGEVVSLIGSNGAGKTTTLRTIQGLIRPREGKIMFEGGPSIHYQHKRLSV